MAAERVLIIGGMGSGKTTLAAEIGRLAELPVHDLDQIVRAGGGTGPLRRPEERDAMVTDIVESPRWVAEGVHLGWTEPLLDAAEVVIWLDHVAWGRASSRMVRRFYSQAFAEARRQRGWRRFFRFRDYGRRLAELARAIPESRRYHRESAEAGRSATAEFLTPYQDKVIHCRTSADVREAVAKVATGG